MPKLTWNKPGTHFFETGVSHGVLFPTTDEGDYGAGISWNGLSKVSESPSGAEEQKFYADNIKYLGITGVEEYGSTIECYTTPPEFAECDGRARVAKGITFGQQSRKSFGFSYQTKKGNDTVGEDLGYVIYLVYGCKAKPSSKDHESVNENPSAATMSYEVSTTPIEVNAEHDGKKMNPLSCLTIDSTEVDADELKAFEEVLYGSAEGTSKLPTPDEVLEMFPKSVAALVG